MDLDYIGYATGVVRICKLLYDYGKLDRVDTGWNADEDAYFPLIQEALLSIADFSQNDFSEYHLTEKLYLSDSTMMEYYRLCRNYCRKFGVKLRDNPYIKEAESAVRDILDIPVYNYGYILKTKINHEWASGILLYYSEYFDGHMELLEALLDIFQFYEIKLEELKAALTQEKTELREAA